MTNFNVIDIKSLKIQRINKEYKDLMDKKVKLEREILQAKKRVIDNELKLFNVGIEIRKIEKAVWGDLK